MTSQFELAWALAKAEAPRLRRADRNRIYAEIGAGETYSAIVRLLTTAARGSLPLPLELIGEIRRWLFGYIGTPDEPRLRRLVDDLQLNPALPTRTPL
jgi:hypothetical protein